MTVAASSTFTLRFRRSGASRTSEAISAPSAPYSQVLREPATTQKMIRG
jgi:hypothetical protein